MTKYVLWFKKKKKKKQIITKKKRYSYVMDNPPHPEYDGIHHFNCTTVSLQNSVVADV